MDVEEEAVGKNREEGRKALDGVDEGDGDLGGCRGGEDVPKELEEGEG